MSNTTISNKNVSVTCSKLRNNWEDYLTIKGKRHHLGYYDNNNSAIQARKDAENKYLKN